MAHPSPYDVIGEIRLDAGGAAILQSLGSANPISFMVGTAALALPPMAAPSLLQFVGTYMTLNDYVPQGFGVSRTNAEALLPQFAADMVFPEMISALAALNHFAHYRMESSSANATRHRFGRSGNRQANHALWRIVMVHLSTRDPATKAYLRIPTCRGQVRP